MNSGQEYVTSEAQYAERASDASGVRGSATGMAPYPLYGMEAMGEGEAALPFWRKPLFCYTVGAAAGFGLGYAFFGWFKPKYMKKKSKKNSGKKPEAED